MMLKVLSESVHEIGQGIGRGYTALASDERRPRVGYAMIDRGGVPAQD